MIVKSPIQSISRYFCNSSGVSTIYIPEGIETIGWNAFNSCYNIASFVIPSSVKTIETRAFYTCFGVKHFYIKPITPPNLSDSNVFYNTPSDCIFHVRPESLEAYKTATNWAAYADRMVGDYVD